jgi:hypothetical protein
MVSSSDGFLLVCRIGKEVKVKVSFLFLAQPNSSNAYSSRDDDG